jgi:hypothetical protein
MANDQVSNEMKAILSARFPGNEADMEIPADEEELRFEAAWTELLERRRAASISADQEEHGPTSTDPKPGGRTP